MSGRPPISSSPCTLRGRAWPATSWTPPRRGPSAAPLRWSRSTPAIARSRCVCRTPPGTPEASWSAWPPAWACGTRQTAATCCRRPRPTRRRGYGMTLLLHSLSTNYNQYLGSRNQSQFGDRDGGSIVITPESRGPDGFYDSYAGADVFEVWADVARRYRLDPDWSVITGYSMGGLGTFKLAEQFPDLFAKAQPTVGFSGDDNLVASLRNIPFLMWNSLVDELVPPTDYVPTAEKFDSFG